MCVKKLNLGSNLTSISLLSSIALHLISYACLFDLPVLFGYTLSILCVRPLIGGAFKAHHDLDPKLYGHMMLLGAFT